MDTESLRQKIVGTIITKTTLKQRIADNTFGVFNLLKEILLEEASELDDELEGKVDRRIRIEYRDRGKYEAQLQLGSDLLIFQMHTDIFYINGSDSSLKDSPYISDNEQRAYCGMINIYNFLSDSFKLNRNADEGYMIGRLFINSEKAFFVEGCCTENMDSTTFGTRGISREDVVGLLEQAIDFALNFDLLTPPYDDNIRVTVDQFNSKMDNSKFVTGKRLGYDFRVDSKK